MTQTFKNLEMSELYSRLSKIGLPPSFIREKALPRWWNSELESNPAAVTEAAGYIAKRLGLDVSSLLKTDAPITFKSAKFSQIKSKKTTELQKILVANSLATRVAEMVEHAFIYPVRINLNQKAPEIRQQIITNHGIVNLESLIQFCWQQGIAVVHFSDYPKQLGKIDGITYHLKNCPVIVISSSHRFPSPACLLFILAHELGHLICGHVKEGILIDESISLDDPDSEEIEANKFAWELLLGEVEKYEWEQELSRLELGRLAVKFSKQDRIDPGILVLNYALKKDWSVGISALNMTEMQANAPALVNQYLSEKIDWERLDADSQDYLRSIEGVA